MTEQEKTKVENLKETLPTWARMELDLMEDNNPERLQRLLKEEKLEEWLMRTQQEKAEMQTELCQQGYNDLEADEIVRRDLQEEYLPEMFS